jgi:hypothetical protein
MKIIFGICLYCFPILLMASPVADDPRLKYNFNSSWKVLVGDPAGAEKTDFDDAAWKIVTLPYAWNEEEAFKKDIRDLSTGIAWYRKHFKLSSAQKDKKVFLEFEGIKQAGDFYINGTHIGLHENGAMAFGFDITPFLRSGGGENILSVRINNDWDYKEKETGTKFQWSDRNFNANYGGITKNVYLHITDKLYQTFPLYSSLKTTGVYVYAQDLNIPERRATVTAETQIKNEYATAQTFQFEMQIQNMEGRIVQTISAGEKIIQPGEVRTFTASGKLTDVNFWSWGYGHLYTVHTILKINNKPVDIVKTKTGFRKTEFTDGMIRLNDRVIMMKGYGQRTSNEWPAVGISIPPWLSDYSNQFMVESNANLVRWMHITPSKQDVESCDRVGLIQAMPAGDSERDVTDRRWDQRVALMRDAIIYNRNNPSILFYESGNKGVSEEHMTAMKAIRDQYDPYGGRAAGSREMLDSKVAEYGGEMLYINKSADIPMWAMEYSRDEALRKYWDNYSPPYHKDGDGPQHNNQDARIYNRNQDSHALENVMRWFDYWRERPGTGRRVSSGGVNIIFSDTNTHHRGAENYRRSGEVDAVRIPKDGFFAHQVMWDGWVDTERPRVHLIGHWNYEEGVAKDIFVVSSAEKVELFINGISAGMGEQQYRFLYTFKDIKWKSGTIKVIGYDKAGKKICEAEKKTSGKPESIRLKPIISPAGLKADGADLALVEVEVIDAQGNRCPTAMNTIRFSMEGPAIWKGGIAQGPDNFILSKDLPVECGVNRVLIRTTTSAGKIRLKATSDGLKSSSITLTSKVVDTTNGLSLDMPADGLSSNLKRGPTPLTPSFTITRNPLKVVTASAGTNAEFAQKSFDDDETTNWKNDGELSTGWITYELERPASVSEIVMRLGGWRSRSYPLRITIDGREVYKDSTERNLGYYTAKFPAAKGKTIKIELMNTSTAQDAFNIVEVTGKKLEAETGNKTKGILEIVEIEFYEVRR